MRILVTGATGFIGRRLCRGLVGRDHDVIAFHRATSPSKALSGMPVEHRMGEITSPDDLAKAMQGVEVVYHLAAPHSAQGGYGKMYATIVEGTRYVLDAALEAGVQRVIFTSAAATVGVGPLIADDQPPEVLDENHVWNLSTVDWPFGYCKYMAEMAVQRALGKGLPVIILNPTYVLGPGDYYRKGHSMMSFLCQRRIPYYLPGGINIVHIGDVVRAHMSALSFGNIGERYLLAGQNVQIRYFQELIAKASGHEPPRFLIPTGLARNSIWLMRLIHSLVNLPMDVEMLRLAGYHFYYNAAKSIKELKLPPYRDAEEIITEAVNWYLQEDDTLII
ncbi:MAG: NAD-dependent epimerase/dehydratase family protein [Anaerolineaceae bacterium]|nr:NAD-dependent epimerase/dehydratase family protein [Anaerolineaceae bacterium]